jgi:hypothetical protein
MITLKDIDAFAIADETGELADAAAGLLRALKQSQARERRLMAVLANLREWHVLQDTGDEAAEACWRLAATVLRQGKEPIQ